MVAAGSVGCIIFATIGFPSRLQSEVAIDLLNYNFHNLKDGTSEEEFWKNGCLDLNAGVDFFRLNGCEQKEFSGRSTVFLIGDSYSAYLSLALRPYLHEAGINLFQYSSYCKGSPVNERCAKIEAHVLEMIAEQRPEVLADFEHHAFGPEFKDPYGSYLPHFLRKVRELENSAAGKIDLMGEMPRWEAPLPKILLRRFVRWGRSVPDRTYEGIERESLEFDDVLKKQNYSEKVEYISLRDNLCNSSGCLVKVGPTLSKDLLVFDSAHLTESGAANVTEKILATAIK